MYIENPSPAQRSGARGMKSELTPSTELQDFKEEKPKNIKLRPSAQDKRDVEGVRESHNAGCQSRVRESQRRKGRGIGRRMAVVLPGMKGNKVREATECLTVPLPRCRKGLSTRESSGVGKEVR
ncbi:hypothetical protein K438DRAFT_1850478 [Mycena galopus ATCC 62051]|nr:hypothetical protein K438DRAFT_1850478 [Mycena galopus ATCC 62051]